MTEEELLGLKYTVGVATSADGILTGQVNCGRESVYRWVMNTQEELTRKALIDLGWTPPPEPLP